VGISPKKIFQEVPYHCLMKITRACWDLQLNLTGRDNRTAGRELTATVQAVQTAGPGL